MTLEMSPTNEVGQSELGQGRAPGVKQRLNGSKDADELFWHDQITKAQRGEYRLRKGARVEHARALVQRLQGLDRPAPVAILAVIVIFENQRPAPLRPVQKLQSSA